MKDNKRYVQLGLMIFSVVAAAIVLFFVVYSLPAIIGFIGKLIKILMPVIIGIVIAYLLNPIVSVVNGWLGELLSHTELKVKTRKKIAKGVAIGVSLTVFIAIIVALLYMVVPEVGESVLMLVNNISNYGETLYTYISKLFEGNPDVQEGVQAFLNEGIASAIEWVRTDLLGQVQKLMSTLSVGIYGVFKTLLNIILGLCVAVYLLVSKHKFIGGMKKLLYASFKKETVNVLLAVGREADSIFGGFISGKLIDSLIIGILCFIGCSIMKMPYLALISVVIGVTNIVPIFGPWVGAIPCSLLVLIVDPGKALIFIIFIILLQQFDGNILGPNILGDSTGLSAFWVVVAITLGGGLFSVPGMILGVPTFAVIYFLIKTYVEFKLKEYNMPIQTISYTKIKRIDPDTLNAEYINTGVSKRERRKQNVFEEDVSREIAIAAQFSKSEKERRTLENDMLFDEIRREGILGNKSTDKEEDDKTETKVKTTTNKKPSNKKGTGENNE